MTLPPDTAESTVPDSATRDQIANTVASDTYPAPCAAPKQAFP